MSGLLDRGRLQEIVDEAGHLVARDGPDAVLDWILVAARELTGARYAALGAQLSVDTRAFTDSRTRTP